MIMNGTHQGTAVLVGFVMALVLVLPSAGLGGADEAGEKPQVMEKIDEKMKELVKKEGDGKRTGAKYSAEEYGIPYNVVFEEDGKLVVGIDAYKAIEFNKRYGKDEVKDLDTVEDIDIRYYVFTPEASVRGGDALGNEASATVKQTITLIRDGKIIATNHGYPEEDQIFYAGIPSNVNCKEVEIVKVISPLADRTSDAMYGRDTYNLFCGHNYHENTIRYKGNIYTVTDGAYSDMRRHLRVYASGAVTGGSPDT